MFEQIDEKKKSEFSGKLPLSPSFLRAWYIGSAVGAALLGLLVIAAGGVGNPLEKIAIFVGGGGAIGALIGMFRKPA